MCTAVMVTPGSRAPLLSATLPVSAASCARPLRGARTSAQSNNTRVITRPLFTAVAPCRDPGSAIADPRSRGCTAQEQGAVHISGHVDLLNVSAPGAPRRVRRREASRANHTALWSVDGDGNNLVRDARVATTSCLQSCGRAIAFEQLWIDERRR